LCCATAIYAVLSIPRFLIEPIDDTWHRAPSDSIATTGVLTTSTTNGANISNPPFTYGNAGDSQAY
jgi:hypothetical protein